MKSKPCILEDYPYSELSLQGPYIKLCSYKIYKTRQMPLSSSQTRLWKHVAGYLPDILWFRIYVCTSTTYIWKESLSEHTSVSFQTDNAASIFFPQCNNNINAPPPPARPLVLPFSPSPPPPPFHFSSSSPCHTCFYLHYVERVGGREGAEGEMRKGPCFVRQILVKKKSPINI